MHVTLSVRRRDKAPLFQAFLLRCQDPLKGSALIASFDHVLGDGASYAMFISHWSAMYTKELLRSPPRPEAIHEVPPHVYPHEEECFSRRDFGKLAHRFIMTAAFLSASKVLAAAKCVVTSNDVMMAQAVRPITSNSLPCREGEAHNLQLAPL